MEREEPEWKKDLNRDLKEIANRYTPDRQPATLETQRAYETELATLEASYQDRLDREERAERRGFDNGYRLKELNQLNEQERASWPAARDSNDLWATRAGQSGEREDLSEGKQNPAYRQTQEYREGMQQLVTEQAYDRDRMDQAFRTVESGLNERFGFTRDRDPDRDRDR